jgi:protein TonB
LSLKRFLYVSLAVHLAAICLLVAFPLQEHKRPEEMFLVKILKAPPEPAPPLKDVSIRKSPPVPTRPEIRAAKEPPAAIKEPARPEVLEAPPAGKTEPPRSPMDMLLDREVIQRIVKAERPTPAEEAGITFDSAEFMYRSYMRRLKEHIEDIWMYPPDAARRKIYGDLYITFVIRKDGSLGSMRLTRTSGHGELDDAAIKALRDSAPFWPLPEGWGKEALTIDGHFIYSLYGAYIR